RRHLEVGEAREQKLDGLRLRPLVYPEERFAAATCEEGCNRLVRDDHQLLDQHVRAWLGLAPRIGDAALAVERDDDLACLDPERAPGEAALAKFRCQALGEAQCLRQLGLRLVAAGQDR